MQGNGRGTGRSYRTNVRAARVVLGRLFGEGPQRQQLARLFAASCQRAFKEAPNSWEVTLFPRQLRLNVGQVAVLSIQRGELFVAAVPPLPRLSPPATVRRGAAPVYPAVPIPSVAVWVPVESIGLIGDRVVAAHREFIPEAASRKRFTPWRRAHSPAAVQVFSEWSGMSIPQPGYYNAPTDKDDPTQEEIESGMEDLVRCEEIERAAVQHVTRWYEARHWKVRSRERDKIGYDLDCTKNGTVRHVEVKGRGTTGRVILLTVQEWARAMKDKDFVLAVVSELGNGSRRPHFQQWDGVGVQKSFMIRPIVYHAKLRS